MHSQCVWTLTSVAQGLTESPEDTTLNAHDQVSHHPSVLKLPPGLAPVWALTWNPSGTTSTHMYAPLL